MFTRGTILKEIEIILSEWDITTVSVDLRAACYAKHALIAGCFNVAFVIQQTGQDRRPTNERPQSTDVICNCVSVPDRLVCRVSHYDHRRRALINHVVMLKIAA